MPELPEVETIRRQLDEVLPGQAIEQVLVLREKSFWGESTLVVGKQIVSVERRAKVLRFNLEEDDNLLIHLKMTGQLIFVPKKDGKRLVGGHPTVDWIGELPSKHTRVIFELTGGRLFFNDQRVFGWIKQVRDVDLEREHLHFGPDIIDTDKVTEEYFYHQLQRSKAAVKLVILDQARFAGVGNIYANDGLYDARIDPRRPAASLSKKEAAMLLASLRRVMLKGIELGGASETNFLHVNGMGGKYQEHFLTYKKQGQRCGRDGCRGTIEKIKIGGRGTFFCPVCQK